MESGASWGFTLVVVVDVVSGWSIGSGRMACGIVLMWCLLWWRFGETVCVLAAGGVVVSRYALWGAVVLVSDRSPWFLWFLVLPAPFGRVRLPRGMTAPRVLGRDGYSTAVVGLPLAGGMGRGRECVFEEDGVAIAACVVVVVVVSGWPVVCLVVASRAVVCGLCGLRVGAFGRTVDLSWAAWCVWTGSVPMLDAL